jgi:hypothetical protein
VGAIENAPEHSADVTESVADRFSKPLGAEIDLGAQLVPGSVETGEPGSGSGSKPGSPNPLQGHENLGGLETPTPGTDPVGTEPWTVEGVAAHLLSRNIRLRLRGRHRELYVLRRDYPKLTDGERDFIRHHQDELRALVQGLASPTPSTTVAPTPAPTEVQDAEPEPVVFTTDYMRRITQADVAASGLNVAGLSRQEVYERARDWLAEQQQQRRNEQIWQECRVYFGWDWYDRYNA